MINLKENPSFLNLYLSYLYTIKNYSYLTIKEYNYDLINFLKFEKFEKETSKKLKEITKDDFKNIHIKNLSISFLNKISYKQIEDYIRFLYYSSYEITSISRKKGTISSFFKYLYEEGKIKNNPCFLLINFKSNNAKKLPKSLTFSQSILLLKKSLNSNCRNNIRNYCVTNLFLNTGLRISELSKINIEDIKLEESKILIHGKGSKERIVYLNLSSLEAITKYFETRKNKNNLKTRAFFLSERNLRLSIRQIQGIIKDELSNISFSFKKSPHTLRHTFASLSYLENQDIFSIQKALGHLSLSSTRNLYTCP